MTWQHAQTKSLWVFVPYDNPLTPIAPFANEQDYVNSTTIHPLTAWQREVSRRRVRAFIVDETNNELQDVIS